MKSFLIALITVLPLACSNNSNGGENMVETAKMDDFSLREEMPAPEPQINSGERVSIEQKLIKEGHLLFETQDLEATFKSVLQFVKAHKGYVQDDNSTKSYNRITRRLTVRIPTEGFMPAIDSISTNVRHFDRKQISSRDVTEEFIDLEARLKAKRELENRYLELLKRAKNVKEVLEVERELSAIREEIEARQGRLNYLKNKVSLSTLTIEFYKTMAQESGVTVSYGQKMWNAVKSGFNGLSYFFLGILTIWPFLIIIGLGVFLGRRWLKKRKK